ncbi:hypothetical protein LH51_17205 [Nitrincola sp. A-D6]|nr:hypothetical protein LH51_17205 [Nitrincola sp. A-D6]
MVFSLLLFIAGLSAQVQADVNSVNASPGSVTLAVNSSTPLNIVWRVNRTETDTTAPGPFSRQVSSANAVLQINGTTVATVGGMLSQTSVLSSNQSATLNFNEVIDVNVGLARRIANSPAGSVRIVRLFDDGQRLGTGSLGAYSGGSSAEGLVVRRIDLAFENTARTDVVEQHTELRAVANITFQSSGVLQGEWRLIDPTVSLGSSDGRVLQVVRQSLISSGEGRTRVVSPTLPTGQQGLYLLAFSVQDTTAQIDIPILRYFVVDGSGSSSQVKPEMISVDQPLENALLDADTLFKWQPVTNAHAYQVEVFAPQQSVPVTGKLVPATELQLALTSMTLDCCRPYLLTNGSCGLSTHRGR